MKPKNEPQLKKRISRRLILFIVALCLSGITAFPLVTEINILRHIPAYLTMPFISDWIETVYNGIKTTEENYPFMAYGTDWLAFAHLVIAVAFWGPLKDPVKNIWVIQFGRIACVMIFPLAFICGGIRGIPFWWQCIDCSFGIVGYALLTLIYRDIENLEDLVNSNNLKTQTL
jgi:hypothetical protein